MATNKIFADLAEKLEQQASELTPKIADLQSEQSLLLQKANLLYTASELTKENQLNASIELITEVLINENVEIELLSAFAVVVNRLKVLAKLQKE
jgi:hypothetical protein